MLIAQILRARFPTSGSWGFVSGPDYGPVNWDLELRDTVGRTARHGDPCLPRPVRVGDPNDGVRSTCDIALACSKRRPPRPQWLRLPPKRPHARTARSRPSRLKARPLTADRRPGTTRTSGTRRIIAAEARMNSAKRSPLGSAQGPSFARVAELSAGGAWSRSSSQAGCSVRAHDRVTVPCRIPRRASGSLSAK
jgi:hypothetical protein